MRYMWSRSDFIQVFVTCPVCGRVWYKRLYSTGAVRVFTADGEDRVEHASCKQLASRQVETIGLSFRSRE